ncbi:MAG TPA: M20/M25/M40 family metallo-hydrolase [Anaerolineae bacterium]|nr:M20/M25/M40 family metallo-hydrolase [Anaerolineae bacterium]HQI87479.1 M20/M25/M40 family metallo-hydrolase [Anaerolineae bacterium]
MNLELLEKLTQTFGPSGYEDEIRAVIRAAVEPLADEIHVDPLGSLVALRKGTGGGKKIALAAHMDEIGLMATYVEEKGFVRFTVIGGGIRPGNGSRVRFANGVTGVIYVERRDDPSTQPELQHLYIDVGATSRADCPVAVGEPGQFIGPLVRQGQRLVSKTMDDRVGCYVLIEVLGQLKDAPHDVYAIFSTQEEIGLVGARTTAFRVDPDIAISIDVTATGDLPKALPMAVELGKGPAIKVKDGGMIAHAMVRDMLVEAAKQAGVPYQMEILLGGTTDAAAMQLVRSGVPSGCLSIPCRFIHSPSEMVDEADIHNAVKLLLTALRTCE